MEKNEKLANLIEARKKVYEAIDLVKKAGYGNGFTHLPYGMCDTIKSLNQEIGSLNQGRKFRR